MRIIACCFMFSIGSILFSCGKKAVPEKDQSLLEGTWVRESDPPGRQPADTLRFVESNGQQKLRFYSAGSPGFNWPDNADTEYSFQGGKLSFKDYSGNSSNVLEVESFEWIEPGKSFSVKLYQVLLYMSADYRVTYKRVK